MLLSKDDPLDSDELELRVEPVLAMPLLNPVPPLALLTRRVERRGSLFFGVGGRKAFSLPDW